MMDKLAHMLKGKPHRQMDDDEKEAKLGVLGDLKDVAEQAMGGRLKGMKKVEIASDSQEGLKAGLDKAREMAGHEDPEQDLEHSDDDHEGEDAEHEASLDDSEDKELDDAPEHEGDHAPEQHFDDIHDGLDDSEIDAKLQHLMALKAKRKK